MSYHGDIALGKTIHLRFTTISSTGAPITLAGTPVVAAFAGTSTSGITAGVSLSVDAGGVTGRHIITVVATSGNGFATDTDYSLELTAGTVDGVSVIGYVVKSFSIEKRSALRPATADRTLVVDAAGLADANVVKLGPTGSGTAQTARDVGGNVDVAVSSRLATAGYTAPDNSTIGAIATLVGATLDATISSRLAAASYTAPDNAGIASISGRLPATLVGGRIDSSVGHMQSDTLTADALAGDAVDEITDAIDVVATAAALNRRADNFVLTTGSVASGDITNTYAVDGVEHQLNDAAGTLDAYYEFDIGTAGAPTSINIVGRANGVNDDITVQAYNWAGATWETVGTIIGQGSGTNSTITFPMLEAHVGKGGANLGLVRVRVTGTGLSSATLAVDQIYLSYSRIPLEIGFVGAVVAATDTTIDLGAAASNVDDFYVPGLVAVIAGTGKGQYGRVTAYDGTTNKRLTLATPFVTVLDTSSVIQIWPWATVRVSDYLTGAFDADAIHASALAAIAGAIEVLLSTTVRPPPGQEAPAADAPLATKIGYVFKAWRHKSTQSASEYQLFADDGTTVDQKAGVSDSGSLVTRDEVESGP